MTAHTPGPWVFDLDRQMDFAVYAGGKLMATVYENADQREARANAQVIAAAPEMYAALVGMMRASGALDSSPATDSVWEAVARAAIARAEGR